VILTAAGRQPNIFFDGVAKAILTTSANVQILVRDPVGQTTSAFGDAWVSSKIYGANDVVQGSDGEFYVSLAANNVNNNPASTSGYWVLLYSVDWNSGITYTEGAVVTVSNLLYQSLQNSNLNKNPTTEAAYWRLISLAYVSTITYTVGQNVVGPDGIFYTALRTTVGDTPASSPSDWVGTSVAAAASATAAAASATAAAGSASTATTQAGLASTSAGTATTQAGIATTQAGIATTQAGNASTSASAASSSAASAAASYDSFDDRYLGPKSSDPTLDNDGNPLLTGALYFNTVSNEMRVYSGAAWLASYLPAGAYATLTGTETLTNKTLTAPTINGITGVLDINTGASIASAATINLDTATGNRVHITGTTAITAVTLTRGPRTVIFDGILTLTHNATTNNLPGAANITTAVGDRAIYESDGTTVYCVNYTKVSGVATVVGSSVPTVIRSARTSNTILGVADQGTLIDITSGTFSQTFTAAATLGSGWFVYLRNSGTGDITLDPNSSELIDGLTTYIMYPGEARLVQCTGTAFTSVLLASFFRNAPSSFTFVTPPGYAAIAVECIAGGGGGGSGTRQPTLTASSGGGGGGGGARTTVVIPGIAAGTSVTATVAAGGAGGAAKTTNGVTGNSGSVGGNTSFGTYLFAYGGGGGSGGENSTIANGGGGGGSASAGGTPTAGSGAEAAGGNPVSTFFGAAGANGRNTGGGGAGSFNNSAGYFAEHGGGSGGASPQNGAGGREGGGSIFGGGGGGGGGPVSDLDATPQPAAGGGANSYANGTGGAAGASGIVPSAGTAGAARVYPYSGAGGGGGGSSAVAAASAGGAGGTGGGGGGGGGASRDGFNSGAGGAGGAGTMTIWGIS